MKQPKRILALLGAVLLAGMYVCTLVFALMKSELAQTLFRASLGCTILVPVLLYAFLLAARMLRPAKAPLVDNVIFDLGNVLIDFGWEELARKNGMTDADIGVMKEKVVGSSYWEEFDYSRIPYEEAAEQIDEQFRDGMFRFEKRLGVVGDGSSDSDNPDQEHIANSSCYD